MGAAGLLPWASPDPYSSRSTDQGDNAISSEGDWRGGAARHSGPRAVAAAQLGPPNGLPSDMLANDLAAACHCAAVVERGCGFLRLLYHTVYLETRAESKRRGVVWVVRFHVWGLPWIKRAKWQQPLLWSVMAVLQSRACVVTVIGGNLYMGVNADRSVRVDFVAARD